MDDAFAVSVVDSFANLNKEVETLFEWDIVFFEVVVKFLTLDEFHGEERLWAFACIENASFVDGSDAGMLKEA